MQLSDGSWGYNGAWGGPDTVSYTHLVDEEGPLQFQPALLDYNDYVGRIGVGRIQRGKIRVNESVTCVRADRCV